MAAYRKLGLFRHMARKPIPRTGTYLKYGNVVTEHEWHCCPRCGHTLNAGPGYQPRYCSQCGQKISFSGIAWKEDRELGFAKEGMG